MPKESSPFLEKKWFLFLLALIFIGTGFFARHHLEARNEFREPVGALCDALMIAALLAIFVDPLLKRTLLAAASKDVFAFAYGYSLHGALKDFVNREILKVSFVRSQCTLQWEIRVDQAASDKVKTTLQTEFHLENFTNKPIDYTHEVFAWSDDPEDAGSISAFYCYPTSNPEAPCYKLEPAQLKPDERGFIRAPKAIKLLPKDQDACIDYVIGTKYHARSRMDGLDEFTVREATAGAKVTVRVEDDLKHLVFSIFPAPDGDTAKQFDRKTEYDKNSKLNKVEWEFHQVFMPGQTIIIRWQCPHAKELSHPVR